METNWYAKLLEDLKGLEFNLIQTKWRIGERIVKDLFKFKKAEYGSKSVENLSEDLHISTSHIYHCIEFYKKFQDYNSIIELKNYSWFYITQNLLANKPKEIKNSEDKKIVIDGKVNKFVIEKIELWRKADEKMKRTIEQDAKNKIKSYRLLLNSIKKEKKIIV